MQAIVQKRRVNATGKVVTVYLAGKVSVRLIGTFGDKANLDDLLYSIGCQKIMDKMQGSSTSLCS